MLRCADTRAQREDHLRRMLPYYPAIARVNELARPGDTVYGLHLEAMRYLARPRFLGAWFGLDLLFEDSAALVYAVRPRHEGGLR